MKRITMVAVAVLAASSMAWAADPKPADPLDGALGPAKPAVDAGPAKPALDPGTAAKNDNNDLTGDLMGGKKPDDAKPDPAKMFQEFIDHTHDAGENMKVNQDPGVETQDHQRRATIAMDALIDIVKEMQKQQQGKPGEPKPGDAKQQNPGQKTPGQHQDGGQTPGASEVLPPGGVNPFKSNGEMIVKGPTEWGILPKHERDVILNSLQDGALKSYQDKVRKYYEALAEIGRGNNK